MVFRDESVIRHQTSNDIDTFRHVASSAATSTAPARPAATDQTGLPDGSPDPDLYLISSPSYGAPMTSSANSVIKAIDDRRLDQTGHRQHLMLFFAQGHYLAGTGAPLFAEPIYATFAGIHVDIDPDEPVTSLDNRQLGFIGYALDRYADMRDADLQSLVQISTAWQFARRNDDDPRIEWAWLTDWFRRPIERQTKPSAREVTDFVSRIKARAGG